MPHVYLLRCADGSLYCGWTTDIDRRLAAHRAGTASRYTRSRLPLDLAAVVGVADRSAALREEARIKRLPRAAKLELIRVQAADASGGFASTTEVSIWRSGMVQ
jgi:putative endonuclease